VIKVRKGDRQFISLSIVPFCLIAFVLLIMPFIKLIVDSFQTSAGQFTLNNYLEIVTNPFHVKAVVNSLKISVISSFVGIIFALIITYTLIKLSKNEQSRILTFLNMLSNYAGVPLALGYMLMLGSSGVLILIAKQFGIEQLEGFNLYSSTGVTLVYIYFQIPMAVLFLYPAFFGVRKEWKEASCLLGANEFKFWRYIGLPVLTPSIVGTFSILFANSMGAYGTAYALVGSGYNLLAVRIASLVSGDAIPQPELASSLSVVLAVTTIAIMLLNEKLARYVRRDLS
jgi:putative spermidine/putrescine transport system permease protein